MGKWDRQEKETARRELSSESSGLGDQLTLFTWGQGVWWDEGLSLKNPEKSQANQDALVTQSESQCSTYAESYPNSGWGNWVLYPPTHHLLGQGAAVSSCSSKESQSESTRLPMVAWLWKRARAECFSLLHYMASHLPSPHFLFSSLLLPGLAAPK